MDATKMNFRDGAFDVSIDKGTYDALAVRRPYPDTCHVTLMMCLVWTWVERSFAEAYSGDAQSEFQGCRDRDIRDP